MFNNKKIGSMIKCLNNIYCHTLDNILKEYDLTFMQMQVIIYIIEAKKNNDHINQRDIENHFSISNPTVTGILNRLENKQLVKRHTSDLDKRVKYLLPSSKSLDLGQHLKDSFDHCDDLLLQGFNENEIKNIYKYLEKMITNIQGGKND